MKIMDIFNLLSVALYISHIWSNLLFVSFKWHIVINNIFGFIIPSHCMFFTFFCHLYLLLAIYVYTYIYMHAYFKLYLKFGWFGRFILYFSLFFGVCDYFSIILKISSLSLIFSDLIIIEEYMDLSEIYTVYSGSVSFLIFKKIYLF